MKKEEKEKHFDYRKIVTLFYIFMFIMYHFY